ncbi:hypothetical protein F5880DRAFT_1504254 [Lentinula raphanica]|nr:hypothetical protein F5880DRAFT_1504254 [Lentinula raphanica]
MRLSTASLAIVVFGLLTTVHSVPLDARSVHSSSTSVPRAVSLTQEARKELKEYIEQHPGGPVRVGFYNLHSSETEPSPVQTQVQQLFTNWWIQEFGSREAVEFVPEHPYRAFGLSDTIQAFVCISGNGLISETFPDARATLLTEKEEDGHIVGAMSADLRPSVNFRDRRLRYPIYADAVAMRDYYRASHAAPM